MIVYYKQSHYIRYASLYLSIRDKQLHIVGSITTGAVCLRYAHLSMDHQWMTVDLLANTTTGQDGCDCSVLTVCWHKGKVSQHGHLQGMSDEACVVSWYGVTAL